MMNNQTSLPAARCDISTKKSSVLLVDNFKVGIAASWRKVASSIIETGQLLLDAEQQLASLLCNAVCVSWQEPQ